MRANSERVAPPQVVADYFPFRRTMIPEVFLQIIVPALLFVPLFSRKRLGEAKTPLNSLSWTILQATPLF
jgi:hypothetical protein